MPCTLRNAHLGVWLCAWTLLMLMLGMVPVHAALPDLQVSKRVLGPNPIESGDLIDYVTTLTFSGPEEKPFSLVEIIPEPLTVSGEVVLRVFSGQTTSRRVTVENRRNDSGSPETVVRWRGNLAGGETRIQLEVPVRAAAACRSGQDNIEARSQAVVTALDGSGQRITVARDFSVQCPPQASLEDIEVSLAVTFDDSSSAEAGESTERNAIQPVAAERAVLTATLTNRGTLPATVGMIMGLPEVPNLRPTEASRFVPVALAPGQTRTVLSTVDLRPFIIHELEKWGRQDDQWLSELSAELHYVILPNLRAAQTAASPPQGSELRSVLRPLQLRAWDVGDAPDSSSRSVGVSMEAYPGVQASFASVFDTPPSAVPGPAHALPRLLHLGRSVSLEADADVGARPNLRPAENRADLDLHDDGTNPSAWQIEHCRSTSIEVQVFISREAQAWFAAEQQTAFLNAWLDFDRNGQWGRVLACPDGRAYEHIVIDHPVDVAALGPGYHRLTIPTGLIHWPPERAADPAWVRLTLSEAPSVKIGSVGNVAFGDGRGPGVPWRFGETEDFLLRPAGSAGSGPDLEVRLSGTSRRIPPAAEARGLVFGRVEWTLLMDYANVGDKAAIEVERILEFPVRSGDLEQLELSFAVLSESRDGRTLYRRLGPDGYRIDGSRVIFQPISLQAGERGRILAFFVPDMDSDSSAMGQQSSRDTVEWTFRAVANTPGEVNPDNRVASFQEVSGLTTEISRIAARSPNSPFWVARGTTNSRQLALRGELTPGETAVYFDEQGKPFRARVDSQGFINLWVQVIAASAEGNDVGSIGPRLGLQQWQDMGKPGAGRPSGREPNSRSEIGGPIIVSVPLRPDRRWSLDLADALAVAELPNGHYRLALGDPDACSIGDIGDVTAITDTTGSMGGTINALACALVNVDGKLPIDPISLGFVAVGSDEDGSGTVISDEDGRPRILGPVTLPDTLEFARGNWSLRLPPSRDGSAYIAVFGLKPGLGDAQPRLIDRHGDQQRRFDAVSTVVPDFFRSERFFFDEADALFGGRADGPERPAREMIVELGLAGGDRELAFAGRPEVAPQGLIKGIRKPVDIESLRVELEVLVGVPLRGELRFVPWNGEPFGQPSRVVWDILDEVITEPPAFDISLPRGIYQLRVRADGYQTYRSPPFFADGPIGWRILLEPQVQRSPAQVVVIDDLGISPAWSELRPGSTVRVINLGSIPRMLAFDRSPARARSGDQPGPEPSEGSGWLTLGEWVDVELDTDGFLGIHDLADPGFRAEVRTTEPDDAIFRDRFGPPMSPN